MEVRAGGGRKRKGKAPGNKAVAATKRAAGRRPTAGNRNHGGLEAAVAPPRCQVDRARANFVQVPEIDVRELRQAMGLSQAQFATKFGFPPATLRNWEQGRSRPDAPTRVLLAVVAKHPEAVEDVLEKAG